MVTRIRGGGGTTAAAAADDGANNNDPKPTITHYLNSVPVDTISGDSRKPSILSVAILIVTQSLNIASAAFVVSGYFGAYAASWTVEKMHKLLLPALSNNSLLSGGEGGGTDNLLVGKYRLSIVATIGILLLHVTGIQPNTIHSRLSDAAFAAILWTYSHLVDPLLGGLIGVAHVSLGIVSTVLSHPSVLDAVEGYSNKDVRLRRLGQYADPDGDKYVRVRDRTPTTPVVTGGPGDEVGANIANAMGSASILLVFPQYFLGLYVLAGVLASRAGGASMSSTSTPSSRRFRRWARWLGEGMVCAGNGGPGGCAAAAVVDGASSPGGDANPWKVSGRLVALYWIIALAKAGVAYVLM